MESRHYGTFPFYVVVCASSWKCCSKTCLFPMHQYYLLHREGRDWLATQNHESQSNISVAQFCPLKQCKGKKRTRPTKANRIGRKSSQIKWALLWTFAIKKTLPCYGHAPMLMEVQPFSGPFTQFERVTATSCPLVRTLGNDLKRQCDISCEQSLFGRH